MSDPGPVLSKGELLPLLLLLLEYSSGRHRRNACPDAAYILQGTASNEADKNIEHMVVMVSAQEGNSREGCVEIGWWRGWSFLSTGWPGKAS